MGTLFVVIVCGEIKGFRDLVNLAIIGVQLIELHSLGFILVNELKDRCDLLFGEGSIESSQYFLELLYA